MLSAAVRCLNHRSAQESVEKGIRKQSLEQAVAPAEESDRSLSAQKLSTIVLSCHFHKLNASSEEEKTGVVMLKLKVEMPEISLGKKMKRDCFRRHTANDYTSFRVAVNEMLVDGEFKRCCKDGACALRVGEPPTFNHFVGIGTWIRTWFYDLYSDAHALIAFLLLNWFFVFVMWLTAPSGLLNPIEFRMSIICTTSVTMFCIIYAVFDALRL